MSRMIIQSIDKSGCQLSVVGGYLVGIIPDNQACGISKSFSSFLDKLDLCLIQLSRKLMLEEWIENPSVINSISHHVNTELILDYDVSVVSIS